MDRVIVDSPAGPVVLATKLTGLPVVLVFPGGHRTAMSDVGWDIIRDLGYGLVTVSRPGYGLTNRGPMSATELVEPLSYALAAIGINEFRAVLGVSFGGMQAVEYARLGAPRPAALILASAATSTLPYPDSRREAAVGPLAFAPQVQRVTRFLVRQLVRSDVGLRAMLGSLSRLPIRTWWSTWSTLVLGSVNDAGVSYDHAQNESATIPGAKLLQTSAVSHLFWLGPTLADLREMIGAFLKSI